MLEQSIFEFEKLFLCAQEYQDDELSDHSSVIEAMTKSLQVLLKDLQRCGEFSDRVGSQIMPQVKQMRPINPVCPLITAINSACRQGVREI